MSKYSFKIWAVTCPDNPNETYYLIDTDGDPRFYCEECGCEHNHIRLEYEDGHKCKELGWTTVEAVIPTLKQGKPEGWRD